MLRLAARRHLSTVEILEYFAPFAEPPFPHSGHQPQQCILHPRMDMMQQCVHLVLELLDPAIGTSFTYGGVHWMELGALLVLGAYSAGVVLVGSEVEGSTPWTNSTVSAKFSLSGCKSTLGQRRGSTILTSSLLRPISTFPVGVRIISQCQMGIQASLQNQKSYK